MNTIILGMGCVNALGDNIREISQNLFKQNSEMSYPYDRLENLDNSFVGNYPVFQVSDKICSQKKENESFSFLFLRKALDEALERANLTANALKKYKVGVCIGTSVDASFNLFNFYKNWKQGKRQDMLPFENYLNYSTAQNVLDYLQIKGISQTITTACASGTDAIGIASEWIETGFCDIAIAGGADEINLIPYVGFSKLMLTSKERCKPFDKNRQGINLGEGAAVLILTGNETHLEKEGAILGYGTSCDGYHGTSPHPEGRGLRKAIDFALKQSEKNLGGENPLENIGFINAHATASIDNDIVEAKIFNSMLYGIPVSATKSLTGHCLGASGAIEAIISLICLNCRQIPKSHNFKDIDTNLNLIPVVENTGISKNISVSDSLSFGGCNSVLILGGENYEN